MKNFGNFDQFRAKCRRDGIGGYAGQTSFFVMMSIIPANMLLISLIRFTPVTETMIQAVVNQYLPSYLSPLVVSIIGDLYNSSIGLVSISVIVALWSAGQGFFYLAKGLNQVYGVEETRPWYYLRFRVIFYTVVAILAIVMALMLLMLGDTVQTLMVNSNPGFANIANAIHAVRFFLMFVVLFFFLAVVYNFKKKEI